MNKVEQLRGEILKIEAQMLEELKKLPNWMGSFEIWSHDCNANIYAFRPTGDEALDTWLQDKVICLKCGAYNNVLN